ncbi:MAG: choice-of-anchor D domain-containing protein [Planctomycetota bacterium]|jgi:outer membrane protein assembly factor BamB
MKRDTWIALAVGLTCLVGTVSSASAQWTIVDTFPVPEGASGLAWDGTWLYCGIYGANGNEIYRIDPVTGGSTLLFTGPQEDAFGLTYDVQYLWTTDHPGSSSIPAVAMRLDWDGSLLMQFDLPDHYMSGIAYDAGDFWVARYYPDPGHIYKVDVTGTVLDDFPAPDNQPWDLCLENGNLWMADYWGDTLYQIDPTTGAVLFSHASEGVDPAGIVWDGQHLWYCDNGEGGVDFLYKVDLSGAGTPGIEIPDDTYDFGAVAIGDTPTWFMTVNSTGDADLEISGVTFSPPDDLSCPAAFPVTIPPAGSDQLPIVYAPTVFGPLDATGTVSSNDPVHPNEQFTLMGHGVYPDPTINLADVAHDYGAVRVSAHTRWFLEVSNHGAQPLTITNITVDDSHFYVDPNLILPIDLGTLESVLIGVWFNPVATVPYAATLEVYSNDPGPGPASVSLAGSGLLTEYPMGTTLWSYLIDTDFDNSPKAMASIPDISGDGVDDVIVCSEDDYVRCFNGNAHGTGDVLWEHEIYAGSVYAQVGLQIMDDIDDDGHEEVVVGSAWGGRLIRAISGRTGEERWTHDTHEYGDGGWVYQVDCSQDYNGDGTADVLAATGDDSSDTGPKRVYCLNAFSGASIWERPLGGPVFAVIGVEDFTGDGVPDAVAGASDESETQGRAVGINGADGTVEWTFLVDGSSVWALAQINDITADGVDDVLVGDFSTGQYHGLDATNGTERYIGGGFGTMTRFERLDDVNGDGNPDFVPTHFSTFARAISGRSGTAAWTTPLVDKCAAVARIADVSGDDVNDVVVGTLFSSNHTYFLDGTDGSVMQSANYGTPVDAITAIPDIVGDGSWEMVAGGRTGLVTCISGGLDAPPPCPLDCADPPDGVVDVVDFLALLAQWGTEGSCDADGDGVSVTDFLLMLAAWGPCP